LHIVAGGWGTGKSSLLNQLLELRPPDERWVVLQNDTGKRQVEAATQRLPDNPIVVKEVVGVCACCTGQVVFVSALAALIRQTKPHRVFVEAASVALLSDLVGAVEQSFPGTVKLETVITLLDPSKSKAMNGSPVDDDQQRLADVIIVLDKHPIDEGTGPSAASLAPGTPEQRLIRGWPDRQTLPTLLRADRQRSTRERAGEPPANACSPTGQPE
jgi:G3E family GTPase